MATPGSWPRRSARSPVELEVLVVDHFDLGRAIAQGALRDVRLTRLALPERGVETRLSANLLDLLSRGGLAGAHLAELHEGLGLVGPRHLHRQLHKLRPTLQQAGQLGKVRKSEKV